MTSEPPGPPGVTVETVRAALLHQLAGMCARTGMYAPTAWSADGMCWTVLQVLAVVDGCEEEWRHTSRRLQREDFGNTGVASHFREDDRAAAEVVAWWVEVASRFGWVEVQPLSPEGWDALLASALVRDGAPWRRVDVEDRLPPASLVVGRTVYCFAPPEAEGRWLFVDISRDSTLPDAAVARVRRPGAWSVLAESVIAPPVIAPPGGAQE